MKKYDSFLVRQGRIKLNDLERELMEVLMEFGKTIDSQDYDDGDYDTAMRDLLDIVNDYYND